MVQRRIQHEPLQYIIGTADFFGLAFEVNPSVLIPRPETEILVDRVLRQIAASDEPLNCLDIGTGSGIIPVSVARSAPRTQWTCMDISQGALSCCHANAVRHDVADRLMLVEGDFLDTIPAGGPWDVVTMNPPYIDQSEINELQPEVRDFEPIEALTDKADGLSFYRRFAEVAHEILAPSGTAFLEIGHGQVEKIIDIFTSHRLTCEVVDDLAGIARLVIVRRK